MKSIEPGEDWGWCYVDQLFIEPAPTEPAQRASVQVSRQADYG